MKVSVWYDSTVEEIEQGGETFHRPVAMLSFGCYHDSIDGHEYNLIAEFERDFVWENPDYLCSEVAEKVWRDFNVVDGTELPVQLGVRSMSIGDVVVLDGNVFIARFVGFELLTDVEFPS